MFLNVAFVFGDVGCVFGVLVGLFLWVFFLYCLGYGY